MTVRYSLDSGRTYRAIVRSCGCGLSFTVEEWVLLPLIGEMGDEIETVELRNCHCGSTLAIEMTE